MMRYKYRWFYAAVVCVMTGIGGYGYVIYPDLRQLDGDRAAVRELAEKLQLITDMNKSSYPDAISPAVAALTPWQQAVLPVSVLTMYSHLAGLSMQSVQRVVSSKDLSFHFLAQGDFRQIAEFISMLEQSAGVSIINFSSKLTEDNKLKFAADIFFSFIPGWQINGKPEDFSAAHNPFCAAIDTAPTLHAHEDALLKSTPLRQMKMTGYIAQERRIQALILLPNNMIHAVEKGMQLGSERGVVSMIEQNRVVVELPDKKISIVRTG